MSNGKLYEILCRRGYNTQSCKFMKQDGELHCSICSYATFKERIKQQTKEESEKKDESQ